MIDPKEPNPTKGQACEHDQLEWDRGDDADTRKHNVPPKKPEEMYPAEGPPPRRSMTYVTIQPVKGRRMMSIRRWAMLGAA